MKNLFSTETSVYQTLNKISLVIWMNVLWLLGCLPIFTIGASTAAYYRMLFNLRQEKTVSFRAFFQAFASNFKKATALWLIQLLAALVLLVLGWATFAVESNLVRVGLVALFLVGLFGASFLFIFAGPLNAYFENSLSGTIRAALAMGLRHYHQSIPALALTLLAFVLMLLTPYWFLRLLPLVLTLGTSALNWGIMLLMEQVFAQYTE